MKTTVTIIGVALLSSFVTIEIDKQFELNEIANTAEDMIEWINHDVESGYCDSSRADSYINNLEQIIEAVDKIKE